MKSSPACFAVALLACACASHPSKEHVDAVAVELREMGRVDQEARKAWIEADNKERGGAEAEQLRKRVIDVDESNTTRLRAIVDEMGWPRRSVVGMEAASSAWLIAQHASDDAFQTRVLELLKPLLDEGEVSKQNYALLDDRVHCHRGEPQTYGTQYRKRVVDGVVHFGPMTPIPDPEHLGERRKSMGLEPQASYVAALRRMYHVPDDAVIDP
jgi:hypothetical protein